MIAHPCRIYDKNTQRMLYPADLKRMGVYLTVEGEVVQFRKTGIFAAALVKLHNVVVMYATGFADTKEELIYEGDILDVEIPTDFGSFMVARGYMAWSEEGRWQVELPHHKALNEAGLEFTNAKRLGDIYQTPQLLKEKHGTPS